MASRFRRSVVTALRALAACLALCAARARAEGDAPTDDPFAYGLRTGWFPIAFDAGISQSHVGSGARAELDLGRRVTLQVSGQGGWLNVTGEKGPTAFGARAGLCLHLVDDIEQSPLAGPVYPEDTPAVGGAGPGTDSELDVPVSSRLGGPEMRPSDVDRTAQAPLRKLQSLRLGYDFARAVERGRPDAIDGSRRFFVNALHAIYLGYGFGDQWNLNAAAAGEKKIGWRHFYLDATLTLPGLIASKSVRARQAGDSEASVFVLGGRIGMEGAIDALLRDAPGLGFAYSLELGALPGRSGIEGYLYLGLGLALDLPVRTRRVAR